MFQLDISYGWYIVFLCILTGSWVLRVDVQRFDDRGLVFESKFSRVLGWINIGIGLVLWALLWIF